MEFKVPSDFIRLPHTRAQWNGQRPPGLTVGLAQFVAEEAERQNPGNADFARSSYNSILVLASVTDFAGGYSNQISGVQPLVGGTAFTKFSSDVTFMTGVSAHELGHQLGLHHANAFHAGQVSNVADDTSPYDEGSTVEYGDPYSVMGPNRTVDDLNIVEKRRLGWLTASQVPLIAASQTLKIYAHDSAGGPYSASQKYGAVVPMDSKRDYWLEYRSNTDYPAGSAYSSRGVQLRWNSYDGSGGGANSAKSILVDPNSLRRAEFDTDPGGYYYQATLDAAVTVGSTFSDPFSNISITTTHIGEDAGGKFCEVRVHMGPASDNAPQLQLDATQLQANVLPRAPFIYRQC